MALEITEQLAPLGTACRSGDRRTAFSGVTIHETGNRAKGAGALAHAQYLRAGGSSRAASWHYCVDDSKTTRSIPESEAAWHSGTRKGNYETISIEICVNADGDFRKACLRAAELAADILKRNGVPRSKCREYLFQHNHWSGKNCPETIRSGKSVTWDGFVSAVASYMGADAANGPFVHGDTVVLTGYLYSDSYGSTKGRYFSGRKATITRIADTSRTAPYLLDGGLGWVRGRDIRRA